MKRLYAEADMVPSRGAFMARLDGKPILTPARRALVLPTERLAEAVAGEWRDQADVIRPATMPLTRLATTVVDVMPLRRDDAIDELHGYASTDLLCYRAAEPAALVERQRQGWQPWLDWAELHLDARLAVTVGVEPIEQPAPALRALRAPLDRLDDWRLTGLHAAVGLTGSLVLGLALERAALDAAHALELALLDELFEIERWGEDGLQRQRHAGLRRDLEAAVAFLAALDRSS